MKMVKRWCPLHNNNKCLLVDSETRDNTKKKKKEAAYSTMVVGGNGIGMKMVKRCVLCKLASCTQLALHTMAYAHYPDTG